MKKIFIAVIKFYKKCISPLTSSKCKYYPTCSSYGLEAISVHGAFKGGLMTVWRILRCNPFSKGGYDPLNRGCLETYCSANSLSEIAGMSIKEFFEKLRENKEEKSKMMAIFNFFGSIFGYVLWPIFYVVQNYGIAIIIFAILAKIVLFPFSIKQQKAMANNARLQKKQKEIQEKYKNNKVKANEEMQKLYQKEGVNPSSGCLTSIVPMLVMLGIFYSISSPLTNTLHLNADLVNSTVTYAQHIPGMPLHSGVNTYYQQKF